MTPRQRRRNLNRTKKKEEDTIQEILSKGVLSFFTEVVRVHTDSMGV